MRYALVVLMALLLFRAPLVMEAVLASCTLFVQRVMPGLFPYMVLSLMLVSRLEDGTPEAALVLMGWCGGSPTGARLLRQTSGMDDKRKKHIAVTCATMSPMFLVGTLPAWTGSIRSGVCILAAVLLGGWVAGMLCGRGTKGRGLQRVEPLSFGDAVEMAAQTMLLVCGTMAMLRTAAELVSPLLAAWPVMQLVVKTLLEVTCGAETIAALPLPLPLRTAMLAGATGFGGAAILLQNRAVLPKGLMRVGEQMLWQVVHGVVSFLVALGMMLV